MKKVKEFTLRKSKNCSNLLFDATGSQCCVTGSFFRACGAPISEMAGEEFSDDLMNKTGKLYSKELKESNTTMYNLLWKAINVNDNKKTSWVRRLKKLREIFGKIGVRIRFRD